MRLWYRLGIVVESETLLFWERWIGEEEDMEVRIWLIYGNDREELKGETSRVVAERLDKLTIDVWLRSKVIILLLIGKTVLNKVDLVWTLKQVVLRTKEKEYSSKSTSWLT